MKKLLVVMLLCGVAIQASYAQTEKGTQNLGLSFGVSTSTTKYPTGYPDNVVYSETKNNTYAIAPLYSYFVADKLDISIEAGLSLTNLDNSNFDVVQKQRLTSLSGTIQLRKYFLFNDKIGVRTGPTFTYQRGKRSFETTPDYEQPSVNSDTYTGGLRLDFVYYPFKKLGVASTISNVNYSYSKSRQDQYKTTSKAFNANFVNSLNLSFFYIF